ncbi:MAG TPA: T9SS type A sorting domain-containing protein [Ignavibacteria bacterium]|nr:T9SS type A sorting domain-containing protein [Ignavibacteria bacterium]
MKTRNIFFTSVLISVMLLSQFAAADIFKPMRLYDSNPPSIIYSPFTNTNSTGDRTLVVNITDPDGVPVSGTGLPVLYWKINNGAYSSVAGVNSSPGYYTFTFGAAISGSLISYYIVAQDNLQNVGVYPSGGASGFTHDPPACSTPPAVPSSYYIDANPMTISYTPLGDVTTTSPRTLTVAITDADGVPTSGTGLPVLYWQINSLGWFSTAAVYAGGNNYQFTFDGGSNGDLISYYIVAQDNLNIVTAYPDVGTSGFSHNPPACSEPPYSPSTYYNNAVPPMISFTPLTNTDGTGNRTLTAAITDADGVPVSGSGLPMLYWKRNTGAFTGVQGTSLGSGQYSFVFGGGVASGDYISYYIVARDDAFNITSNKLKGAHGFSYDPPACSTPPSAPDQYLINNTPLSGNYYVGLNAFNKLTGKNIYFEKTAKKVMKEVEVQMADKKHSGKILIERKTVETDETVWTPMENGKKYEGKLYALKSENPEYDYPMNSNGTFATITSAVFELNTRGVSGASKFLLADALYSTGESFPIIFNFDQDPPTAVNTVTLKPTQANTSITSSVSGNPVIREVNDYIIFDGSVTDNGTSRDLTISHSTAAGSQVIQIISPGTIPLTGAVVKNCILNNNDNSTAAILVTNFSALGGYFNNITIQNNSIQNAWYGLYCRGVSGNANNLNITGNELNTAASPIRQYGIYADGFNGVDISGNDVANFESSGDELDDGIWVGTGTINAAIENNKIYNLGYTGNNGYSSHAIRVETGTTSANVTVVNNAIYNIFGRGFDYTTNPENNPIAIYLLSAQSGIKIYFNSINLYGSTLIQFNAMSMGIFLASGSSADTRNNNIVNNLGSDNSSYAFGTCAIYAQTGSTQFENIDFNNYFVNPVNLSGNGKSIIGISNTTAAYTLADWAAATGKDIFSVNGDPGYTSNTNLMPSPSNIKSWNVNAGALPMSGVSTDINGNPRSTSVSDGAADIGAYEFTPSTASAELTKSGIISDGSIYTISFAGVPVAQITWHANGGTLPTSVTPVFQPGVNPPNPVSGSRYTNENFDLTANGGSGFLYDITIRYNMARLGSVASENALRIAKYTSSSWFQYTTVPNTTNKTVNVTGLNSFSTFTFGDGDAPLPVSLLSFMSNINGRDVTLTWKTEKEINNAGFEIERKSYGTDIWVKAGFTAGKGNSNNITTYTFTDNKLNSGKYNYRLKQIDNNGNYEYYELSGIVDVSLPVKYSLSQNYPNPFNPSTKIDYDLPFDSKVKIALYDITGREAFILMNETKQAGYYTAVLNASSLSSGIYFYRITASSGGNNFIMTKKMVLIK